GGDEFALLLEDLPDDADQVARRIVDVIAQPVTFTAGTAGTVTVSASVGVVVADLDRRTAEQLLHAADTTMYSAKRSGKGAYRVSVVAG
ncbi:MAG: diguanylate cyclase domain-containing protein, partial [Cellulomonas sp.]